MTVSICLIIYSLQLAALGLLILDLFIIDLPIILLDIFILTAYLDYGMLYLRSLNLLNQESAEILFCGTIFYLILILIIIILIIFCAPVIYNSSMCTPYVRLCS